MSKGVNASHSPLGYSRQPGNLVFGGRNNCLGINTETQIQSLSLSLNSEHLLTHCNTVLTYMKVYDDITTLLFEPLILGGANTSTCYLVCLHVF